MVDMIVATNVHTELYLWACHGQLFYGKIKGGSLFFTTRVQRERGFGLKDEERVVQG